MSGADLEQDAQQDVEQVVEQVVALSRRLAGLERDIICGGDVTSSQCVTLQALLDHPLLVSQVAEGLRVSLSAGTHLVDGMQERGWVRRVRDPDDGRRKQVQLTAKGRREGTRLKAHTARMVDVVWEHVPEAKRASVAAALATLNRALGDAEDKLQSCCPP